VKFGSGEWCPTIIATELAQLRLPSRSETASDCSNTRREWQHEERMRPPRCGERCSRPCSASYRRRCRWWESATRISTAVTVREQTALYPVIETNLTPFLAHLHERDAALPRFRHQRVEGLPALRSPGTRFVRVKCDGCRHEYLVAFSCKRRGFCPSCGAHRMIETSAHLIDHVLPEIVGKFEDEYSPRAKVAARAPSWRSTADRSAHPHRRIRRGGRRADSARRLHDGVRVHLPASRTHSGAKDRIVLPECVLTVDQLDGPRIVQISCTLTKHPNALTAA
jgi:ribosomal protein S27E